jgi:predicted nucleic acid-binding protein
VFDLARDGLLYLDTSALMKLVFDEAESAALRDELEHWGDGRFVTSALTKVELPRAVSRAVPPTMLGDRLRAVARLINTMSVIPLHDDVLAIAAAIQPPLLRSLDAIHLASAGFARVEDRTAVMCCYDLRLRAAAEQHGHLAISPGR